MQKKPIIRPATTDSPKTPLPVELRLRRKLDPARFPRMSDKMRAIVAHIIGVERWVSPPVRELTVTSDLFVLARVGDQIGFDTFVGSYTDLARNWLSLLAAAGLTTDELWEADCRFAARVGFYGRTTA
jgi:hypothetical protein